MVIAHLREDGSKHVVVPILVRSKRVGDVERKFFRPTFGDGVFALFAAVVVGVFDVLLWDAERELVHIVHKVVRQLRCGPVFDFDGLARIVTKDSESHVTIRLGGGKVVRQLDPVA